MSECSELLPATILWNGSRCKDPLEPHTSEAPAHGRRRRHELPAAPGEGRVAHAPLGWLGGRGAVDASDRLGSPNLQEWHRPEPQRGVIATCATPTLTARTRRCGLDGYNAERGVQPELAALAERRAHGEARGRWKG